MKVRVLTNSESFRNELEDVVRAFDPFLELSDEGEEVIADVSVDDCEIVTYVKTPNYPIITNKYSRDPYWDVLLLKRHVKRFLKRDFYDAISLLTEKKLYIS